MKLLVSSIWFLLYTGQVAIGSCDSSLPVCVRWSDLLFLSGGGWVVLQLQLWLISYSSSKVRQFSFLHHPQSYEIISAICHTPSLGGWLVSPTLLSVFIPHSNPTCWVLHWESLFSEVGSEFHPTLTVSGRLQLTVYVFQFCSGGVQLFYKLHWIILWESVWSMALTCWVYIFTQADFKMVCRKE
jgi:hypothetical protein